MFISNEVSRHALNNLDSESNALADQRSTMLIVEDALIHSNIINRIAGRVGFIADGARSYEDACKILSERQFDCITLDLVLGEHVGLDVLRYLAAIRCRAQIIVISQSDRDVCDDMVQLGRALDLNVYVFVQKPIDITLLRDTLEHIRMQLVLQKLGSGHV